MKPALPRTMVGEEEVFIDIVDGAVTTTSTPVKPAPKPVDEPAPATTEVAVGGSVLEAEIVTEATGQYEVTWPILGMDCPDCASKATRALKHLDQVWARRCRRPQAKFGANRPLWGPWRKPPASSARLGTRPTCPTSS